MKDIVLEMKVPELASIHPSIVNDQAVLVVA
jgi:hypothetical protein